jgi:transcriptional regulator with XRE-family HTH domain
VAPRSFERDESLVALGQAVRAIRLERKMSQEELSTRAGVHVTYVSHIESARRNLTWTATKKISQALGVTMSELVQMAEEIERED